MSQMVSVRTSLWLVIFFAKAATLGLMQVRTWSAVWLRVWNGGLGLMVLRGAKICALIG